MTMMTLTQNEQPVSSGFRVDMSRGERVGRVSSEWFYGPARESTQSDTGGTVAISSRRAGFARLSCIALSRQRA
jgi:hypothetical protein